MGRSRDALWLLALRFALLLALSACSGHAAADVRATHAGKPAKDGAMMRTSGLTHRQVGTLFNGKFTEFYAVLRDASGSVATAQFYETRPDLGEAAHLKTGSWKLPAPSRNDVAPSGSSSGNSSAGLSWALATFSGVKAISAEAMPVCTGPCSFTAPPSVIGSLIWVRVLMSDGEVRVVAGAIWSILSCTGALVKLLPERS